MTHPHVSLIVPCYNEIDGLPQLVTRLSSMRSRGEINGWEVLFIDDGSTDGTGPALEQLRQKHHWVRVIHHPVNRGLGAALRTGFACAEAPVVCTMDSDCTFAPETLPRMVEMLAEGADIVTASPWHPQSELGKVHPVRKMLSKGASRLYRSILGGSVYSFTPLHRAYRKEVIKSVHFESNGFSGVAEFLVRAIFGGYKVKELPMRLERRLYGESKINITQSVFSHLSLMRLALTTVAGAWVAHQLGTWGRMAIGR
ncbi:MAG: glycosyltransferase family 2 protein [Acidimicrobiia bacterium]|nr:glycosyltransferase family 2 protein [Acidimicrobiia bacterium]